MTNMKIAVWHDPYSPIVNGSVGGEDNLVELEIRLLEDRGHEVIHVMKSFEGMKRKTVHALVTATGYGQSSLREVLNQDVDLIHTNNMSIASGYAWMRKNKFPLVSSFHNYRPLCPISTAWRDGKLCFDCTDKSSLSAMKNGCGGKIGVLGSIRKSIFQPEPLEVTRPTRVIFTSNKMANAYLPRIPEVRFNVLHNPSRLVLSDTNEKEQRIQQASGFLFAGRLTQEKGVLQLLNHWPDNELLTIAGKGELETEVKRVCEARSNLTFMGTFSPNDTHFYRKFEALIFPSAWLEGSPLVVTEAISSGVPVIATNTSSAEELIKMSGCGVIIQQDFTSDTLQGAIDNIRKNKSIYRENGIAAASSHFSPNLWIQKLENIFLETLIESKC